MGEAGHNAGFPLFSKPAGGKITRHLRKITKDLVETTKHLGKTIRHLVFSGCYLGIFPVAGGVTKKATKPLLNIIYIKNGSGTVRPLSLPCVCWGRQKPEKTLAEDGAAPCCQASILVL